MDYLFQTGQNRKHILYSTDAHILLRQIQSDMMSRPSRLANDFLQSLSGTVHNNIIYYTYVTINKALTLKHIYSPAPFLYLSNDDFHHYEQTFITTFNNHLILFYCVNDPSTSTWDIKYILSPESTSADDLHTAVLTGLTYSPSLSILNTESRLIISIHGEEEKHILELTSDMTLISHDEITDNMEQQSRRQLERINELQNDIDSLQQASNLMMSKISSLLEENEKLKNECSRLKESGSNDILRITEKDEELKKLTSTLNETKKALTIREAQIESAKNQYNELMDVAQKYRDEAIKWRTKLTSKQ